MMKRSWQIPQMVFVNLPHCSPNDYHIKIVKLLFAYNRPTALILNSFHFGNSCLTAKFSRRIDILQMLAYGRLLHAK